MGFTALIPARKGSKGIPNKNIVDSFGKPLIYWTIEKALKSNCFDSIIVSTDSVEIAEISMDYGAEVPYLRPKNISCDNATRNDVINFFMNRILMQMKLFIYNPLLLFVQLILLGNLKILLVKFHNSHLFRFLT